MLKLQLIWGDNLGNLVNRAVSLCGGSVPSGKVSVPPPFNLKELKTAVKDVQTSGAARRRNTRILLSRNECSKWAFQPDWSCIFPSIYRNTIGTCMSSQVCIAGILIQPISSNSNSRWRTCMAWGLWILSSFRCGSSCDWGCWKTNKARWKTSDCISQTSGFVLQSLSYHLEGFFTKSTIEILKLAEMIELQKRVRTFLIW